MLSRRLPYPGPIFTVCKQFQFKAAPDFENPIDVGTNNIYEVELEAHDGNGLATTQTVSFQLRFGQSMTSHRHSPLPHY